MRARSGWETLLKGADARVSCRGARWVSFAKLIARPNIVERCVPIARFPLLARQLLMTRRWGDVWRASPRDDALATRRWSTGRRRQPLSGARVMLRAVGARREALARSDAACWR